MLSRHIMSWHVSLRQIDNCVISHHQCKQYLDYLANIWNEHKKPRGVQTIGTNHCRTNTYLIELSMKHF